MNLFAPTLALSLLVSTASAQGIVAELDSPFAPEDLFGFAVALEGDWAAVANERFGGTARVAVFRRDSFGWSYFSELDPGTSDPDLDFGIALDMDDGRIAVGATGYDGNRGGVFLYSWSGSSWDLDEVIAPTAAGTSTGYGIALDLDGGTLAAGEVGGSHQVYVHEEVGGQWTLVQAFAPASYLHYTYGRVLAIEGDHLIVSAELFSSSGDSVVYAYRRVASVWTPVGMIEADTQLEYDHFGGALDIEGDELLIGARGFAAGGAAFLFEATPQGWQQNGERIRVPGFVGDLGNSVALQGDLAVLSSPGDSGTVGGGGAVFTFHREDGTFRPTGRFEPSTPVYLGRFGREMSLDGETLLVGSPSHLLAGIQPAAILALPEFATPYGTCRPTDAPCGNADAVAGCTGSVGEGATLRVSGSASLAADDLVFTLAPLPSFQFGLLYMGGAPTMAVFGDGLRLVAPGSAGIFRYPVRSTGSEGSFEEGPGLGAFAAQNFGSAGALLPGATWYFQGWFRDPAGPCGSGFNLTPGLAVRLAP